MRGEMIEGTRLGAYEVGVRLGQGSLTDVFEGRHVELGKAVAIKVLRAELASSPTARDRFLAYGRAAAILDHPHAVRIVDAGADGDVAFLVTDLLRGDRLSDLLRAGSIPLAGALALVLPVASALAYAHDRAIAHGHVGPREIFLPLDRHGDPEPKLADFRLCAACVEAGVEATPAADLAALAATLIEAIGGPAPVAPDAFPDVRSWARALLPHAAPPVGEAWERDFAERSGRSGDVFSVAPSSSPNVETIVGGALPGGALPKLPFPAGTSTFYIKGSGYRGVVRLIERKVPGGFPALSRTLDDPQLVAFLRQPFLSASRYDVLPMLPINATIARVLGKPLATLAAEQGAAQASHDVQYVYRRLFESMTLDTLHSYVPRLAEHYFDFGECTAEWVGPDHVVVHRRRLPEYVLPWFAPAQTAYLEEVVRWKGATSVQATMRPPLAAASKKGLSIVDLDTELRWQ
jgi:serine/threonine protein kinase